MSAWFPERSVCMRTPEIKQSIHTDASSYILHESLAKYVLLIYNTSSVLDSCNVIHSIQKGRHQLSGGGWGAVSKNLSLAHLWEE